MKTLLDFERKLIADWLRYHVKEELLALIESGDYRFLFAHGTLPDKYGEFFQPFEMETKELSALTVTQTDVCPTCHGFCNISDRGTTVIVCPDCEGTGNRRKIKQESFQDAVRNDPDMTAEQKDYWLLQPPGNVQE